MKSWPSFSVLCHAWEPGTTRPIHTLSPNPWAQKAAALARWNQNSEVVQIFEGEGLPIGPQALLSLMPASEPQEVSLTPHESGNRTLLAPKVDSTGGLGPASSISHMGVESEPTPGGWASAMHAPHPGFPKTPQFVCIFHSRPGRNIYFYTHKYCSNVMAQLSVCLFFFQCVSPLPCHRYLRRYTYCTPP